MLDLGSGVGLRTRKERKAGNQANQQQKPHGPPQGKEKKAREREREIDRAGPCKCVRLAHTNAQTMKKQTIVAALYSRSKVDARM